MSTLYMAALVASGIMFGRVSGLFVIHINNNAGLFPMQARLLNKNEEIHQIMFLERKNIQIHMIAIF